MQLTSVHKKTCSKGSFVLNPSDIICANILPFNTQQNSKKKNVKIIQETKLESTLRMQTSTRGVLKMQDIIVFKI